MSETISAMDATAPTASSAARWFSPIRAVMRSVAWVVWLARLLIRLATRAAPGPAPSPRLASMMASRASMLVWMAASEMESVTVPISRSASASCRTWVLANSVPERARAAPSAMMPVRVSATAATAWKPSVDLCAAAAAAPAPRSLSPSVPDRVSAASSKSAIAEDMSLMPLPTRASNSPVARSTA